MSYEVRFLPRARDDLIELHAWVEAAAGIAVADAYQMRMETRCLSLAEFPERGTPRDEIAPGKPGVWGNVAGSGLTSDGAHANVRGNMRVQSAGVVPSVFVR
jgi:plasmid stabilization system protein ParE